jgi:hypothetical protein
VPKASPLSAQRIAEKHFSRHSPARSRHKPISLPTMATTTTNLASWTAYRRRHAGIAERPACPALTSHCCHATTSTPRTRPPLPASSTPALPRPPPGAHGQPSHAGARPVGRLPGQPCRIGVRRHRTPSRAAKPPPLSAPSHRLRLQPLLIALVKPEPPPLAHRRASISRRAFAPALGSSNRRRIIPRGHRIHTRRRRIRPSLLAPPRAVLFQRLKRPRSLEGEGEQDCPAILAGRTDFRRPARAVVPRREWGRERVAAGRPPESPMRERRGG